MTNYEDLSRKELQALAKEHGIKANLATAAIIEALRSKHQANEEAPVNQTIIEEAPAAPETIETALEEPMQAK
ncbi:hypothetical protein EON65_35730, partial [archaeon]